MSSTNLTNLQSKVTGYLGTAMSLGVKLTKLTTLAPLTSGLTGVKVAGRFLAYTTLGRATILVVMLLGTFTYFKAHFTAVERNKWEAVVEKKQDQIIDKVVGINAETQHAQKLARAQNGMMDRILAVVVDGIWKVQAPHPIEAETIELINETRGKK
jgi:hypothetical protein